MKNKQDSQLPLWTEPEVDNRKTAASKALLHFSNEYIRGMQTFKGPGPIPREMDELAFVCLLLCVEHPV
jgi:hypothetical protein